MVEEILHAKPILKIPEQQLLVGKLNELRRQRNRLRAKESVKQCDMAIKQCLDRLIAMGRQDLTKTF